MNQIIIGLSVGRILYQWIPAVVSLGIGLVLWEVSVDDLGWLRFLAGGAFVCWGYVRINS